MRTEPSRFQPQALAANSGGDAQVSSLVHGQRGSSASATEPTDDSTGSSVGSSFVVGDTTRLVWDGRSPDFLAHQLGNSPAGSLATIASLAARMLTPPLTVLPPSLSVRN